MKVADFITTINKEKQEFVENSLKGAFEKCISTGIKISTNFMKRLILEKGDIQLEDWTKLGLQENEEIITYDTFFQIIWVLFI